MDTHNHIAMRTLHQTPVSLAPEQSAHEAPLFLYKVPAGFPSPATDYMEDGLDLNEFLIQHKAATFLFRVQGNSMREAGIVDGDNPNAEENLALRKLLAALADFENAEPMRDAILFQGELGKLTAALLDARMAGRYSVEQWQEAATY